MKTLYFDLDDVLANFNQYANEVFSSNYKTGDMLLHKHWDILCEEHPRMFRSLTSNQAAIGVVYKILATESIKVRILTALPFDDRHTWQYATIDKVRWCDDYLKGVPMFVGPYAHDKWRHCTPGDLLIDDKQSNCDEWVSAGGQAYLYRGNIDEMTDWIRSNL